MAKLPSLISKYFGGAHTGILGAAESLHAKKLRGPSKILPNRNYAGFVYRRVYGGAVLEGKEGGALEKTIYLPSLPMIRKGPALSPELIYSAAEWYSQVPRTTKHPKMILLPSSSLTGAGTSGSYSPHYKTAHAFGHAKMAILPKEPTSADFKSTLSHEMLHHIYRVVPNVKKEWENVETEKSPTGYGKKNEREDFAESGITYLRGEHKKLTPDRMKIIKRALKAQPLPSEVESNEGDPQTLYIKGKKIWVPDTATTFSKDRDDNFSRRGVFLHVGSLPVKEEKSPSQPTIYLRAYQHREDKPEIDQDELAWLKKKGYDYAYANLTRFHADKYKPLHLLQRNPKYPRRNLGIESASRPEEYREPLPISGQRHEQIIRKGYLSRVGGLFKAPGQITEDVYKQSFQYKTWLANTQARNLTDKNAPEDFLRGGKHSFGSRWHPPEIREEREAERTASKRSALIPDPYKNIAANISAAFGKIPYDETRTRLKVARAKSRTNKIEVEKPKATRSEFLKAYWQYRKEGGEMSMAAYSRAVKDSLTETPNMEKPFQPGQQEAALKKAEEKKLRTDSMATPKRKEPLEIWSTPDGSWTWEVLRKYSKNDDAPHARWFCNVKSPYVPEGELGDVYVREIKSVARRKDVATAPLSFTPPKPEGVASAKITFRQPKLVEGRLAPGDKRFTAFKVGDRIRYVGPSGNYSGDKTIYKVTLPPKLSSDGSATIVWAEGGKEGTPTNRADNFVLVANPKITVSSDYQKEPSEEEAEAVFSGYAGYPSNILDKEYREKELAHALKETREWAKRRHERDENAESFDFLPESFENEPGESHGKIIVSDEPEEPGAELRETHEISSLFENRKQLGAASEDKEGK